MTVARLVTRDEEGGLITLLIPLGGTEAVLLQFYDALNALRVVASSVANICALIEEGFSHTHIVELELAILIANFFEEACGARFTKSRDGLLS